MPASFNVVTIVGHLGRDPEARTLPDGTAVCDFSVATTERRKGSEDLTTWFRVSCFGRTAEIAQQYLHKGSYAYIQGRLSQNDYTGRDGTARTSLEVRASDLKMLDRRADGENGHAAMGHATPASPADDTLPF